MLFRILAISEHGTDINFANWPVGAVEDIAVGAWRLGFDSTAGQIALSPTARHHCDVSVLPWRFAAEKGSATRYTLRRNTASMMKILF